MRLQETSFELIEAGIKYYQRNIGRRIAGKQQWSDSWRDSLHRRITCGEVPTLEAERLFDEILVYATTSDSAAQTPPPEEGNVYVGWGPDFYAQHSIIFPEFTGTKSTANVGWLGLQHFLQSGGAGYFPTRSIRPHLDSGRLYVRQDAPQLHLSAYMVYPVAAESEIPDMAMAKIRGIAASIAKLA